MYTPVYHLHREWAENVTMDQQNQIGSLQQKKELHIEQYSHQTNNYPLASWDGIFRTGST